MAVPTWRRSMERSPSPHRPHQVYWQNLGWAHKVSQGAPLHPAPHPPALKRPLESSSCQASAAWAGGGGGVECSPLTLGPSSHQDPSWGDWWGSQGEGLHYIPPVQLRLGIASLNDSWWGVEGQGWGEGRSWLAPLPAGQEGQCRQAWFLPSQPNRWMSVISGVALTGCFL